MTHRWIDRWIDGWMGNHATSPFKTGQLVCSLLLPWLTSITQIHLSCGKMIMPGDSKPHLRRSRRRSKVSCIDRWTLIYRHYSHYLQLFSMIKHSWPRPAIQLSQTELVQTSNYEITANLTVPEPQEIAMPINVHMGVLNNMVAMRVLMQSDSAHKCIRGFFFFLNHC